MPHDPRIINENTTWLGKNDVAGFKDSLKTFIDENIGTLESTDGKPSNTSLIQDVQITPEKISVMFSSKTRNPEKIINAIQVFTALEALEISSPELNALYKKIRAMGNPLDTGRTGTDEIHRASVGDVEVIQSKNVEEMQSNLAPFNFTLHLKNLHYRTLDHALVKYAPDSVYDQSDEFLDKLDKTEYPQEKLQEHLGTGAYDWPTNYLQTRISNEYASVNTMVTRSNTAQKEYTVRLKLSGRGLDNFNKIIADTQKAYERKGIHIDESDVIEHYQAGLCQFMDRVLHRIDPAAKVNVVKKHVHNTIKTLVQTKNGIDLVEAKFHCSPDVFKNIVIASDSKFFEETDLGQKFSATPSTPWYNNHDYGLSQALEKTVSELLLRAGIDHLPPLQETAAVQQNQRIPIWTKSDNTFLKEITDTELPSEKTTNVLVADNHTDTLTSDALSKALDDNQRAAQNHIPTPKRASMPSSKKSLQKKLDLQQWLQAYTPKEVHIWDHERDIKKSDATKNYKSWVEDNMQALALNPKSLAAITGMAPALISDVIKGFNVSPFEDELLYKAFTRKTPDSLGNILSPYINKTRTPLTKLSVASGIPTYTLRSIMMTEDRAPATEDDKISFIKKDKISPQEAKSLIIALGVSFADAQKIIEHYVSELSVNVNMSATSSYKS